MEQLIIKHSPVPLMSMAGENRFMEEAVLRTYRRNTLLYSPQDTACHAFLVSHGEVKISRYSPEGRELTLGHLGEGELFGEMEIFMDMARESQALARTDTTLYVLDKECLLKMMGREPDFNQWMTRNMMKRQSRLETRLETLLFKSANGKVAQVLVDLARDYGRQVKAGTLIDYAITHQEIGNLIATTRETVSYAFMEFRQLGFISTRQRRTIIHNLQKLAEMALV